MKRVQRMHTQQFGDRGARRHRGGAGKGTGWHANGYCITTMCYPSVMPDCYRPDSCNNAHSTSASCERCAPPQRPFRGGASQAQL